MKELVKKALKSIKRDGLCKTTKKTVRVLVYKFRTRKKNDIRDYVNINDFETIIVFENNFGWNKIMRQRPQQIASSLPSNTLMFYHSHEDEDYIGKLRIKKLKDNLILIDLGYFRDLLLEELANHNNKYLMVYSTDYIPYDRIEMYMEYDYQLLYEYVDDFNADLCGQEMYDLLTDRHEKIIKGLPFVVCTAKELFNHCVEDKVKYTTIISNGVDYDHFKNSKQKIPNDLIKIRKENKYLICYYGALASWFDYKLIGKLANNKDLGIVLIGQDYDNTLEKSKILDYENVYYLGKKNYDELPAYGYNVDLFMIPFLINDITKATSPVKIFEYMAMEKPIITTALPECKKYKSVLYSNSDEEFLENVKKGIGLIGNKKYTNLLDKEAKSNTWISKASSLVKFINSSKRDKIENQLMEIFKNENYDRIVVWRSPFGWNVPLFQRPQHIAQNLANQKCLMFYEVTSNTDVVKKIKKISDNLYLVNFGNSYVKTIFDDIVKKIKIPKYLQIYSTNWSMNIKELKEYKKNGFTILYEYIDDICPELAGTDEIPKYIKYKYKYAMSNKDVLVVTTANALYEDVKAKRGIKNLILSCNGVDYDFFQKIDKNFQFENEFINVINNGKINICYYGALASWFDYELIKKINDTDKYNIILFGLKYDKSYDKNKINKLNNVHFFGPRDYKVLKNYASKMDILIIPFVINSITQATSPLKLFEYMALHKPIVTTSMNECKNYKSVLIGENHEDFIKKLEEAIELKNDVKYNKLLEEEGKNNDWNHKARLIIELMEKNEGRQKCKK